MTETRFDRFYERTAGPLHAYVSRMSGSGAVADDVVQDAYIRFLGAPDAPDDEPTARIYLFRIATNLFHDHLRREDARRRRQAGAVEAWGDREVRAPDVGASIDVRRALGRLRPRDREVLWLAHVVGMKHREIATVIGVEEGSVKVLASRARKRFREVMEDHTTAKENR